jgi:hypothetical protein
VTSNQVDTKCLHSIRYPLLEAEFSTTVQKAKVSKLQMASDAEDILDKVDSIMGEMRTNPVADIEEEFLENNLERLDSLMNDLISMRTRWIIP